MSVRMFGTCSAWLLALALSSSAHAGDWPQWGGGAVRNFVSPETGLPASFDPGQRAPGAVEIDPSTTRNIRWTAKLGSQTYGGPVVADGRIYVSTNDSSRRDPKHKGDGGGVVLCLDEATGEMLWQLVTPRMRNIPMFDNLSLGICSTPTVEGDRVYVVTNRCEVLCLDADGMADGNDGPYRDEATFMAIEGDPPLDIGPTDADILWCFDMRDQVDMWPHDATDCSVLIHGDLLYTCTSNAVENHDKPRFPLGPSVIVLDKRTGQLVASDAAEIGTRMFHGQWSSPSLATVGAQAQVLFGAGDGMCYAFDPAPVREGDRSVLRTLWVADCNTPAMRFDADGNPRKYPSPEGASEVIATPVFHEGCVYVGVGQDPRHGSGKGLFCCIDASGSGEVTATHRLWTYDAIDRTLSSASVADGLVYIADYEGKVHCLDAATGEPQWVYDTGGHIWGSTLVADGKVYIGNERRWLTVLAAGRELRELTRVRFPAPIYTTPVAANGVLYVATQTHLYAIEEGR